jgi:hypothetical protein
MFIMKNKIKGFLELKKGDSLATLFGKGMLEGTIQSALVLGGTAIGFLLVGRMFNRNDEVDAFNHEMEAE